MVVVRTPETVRWGPLCQVLSVLSVEYPHVSCCISACADANPLPKCIHIRARACDTAGSTGLAVGRSVLRGRCRCRSV